MHWRGIKTIKIYVVKSTKMYTDSELSGHNTLLWLVVTVRYSETGFFTPKSCYVQQMTRKVGKTTRTEVSELVFSSNPARLIHWPPLIVIDIVLDSLTISNLESLTRSNLRPSQTRQDPQDFQQEGSK